MCPDTLSHVPVIREHVSSSSRVSVSCAGDDLHQLQFLELNKTETKTNSGIKEEDRNGQVGVEVSNEDIKPVNPTEANLSEGANSDSSNSRNASDKKDILKTEENDKNINELPDNLEELKLTSRIPVISTKTSTTQKSTIGNAKTTTLDIIPPTSPTLSASFAPNISSPTSSAQSASGSSDLVKCYSCGSLFSSVSSDCEVFDKTDENQQVTCEQGEACLYYAWQVSSIKTGRYIWNL